MDDEIQTFDTGSSTDTTSYTPYELINFENGTLVSPGKIDLETCEITMPVYSGKAPMNATNLNHMEQGIKNLEELVLSKNNVIEGSLNTIFSTMPGEITTNDFPVLAGYKINNKDVYVVRASFQLVDLATRVAQKEVSVQMNLIKIVDIRGVMYDSAGENYMPLPDTGNIGANNGTRLVVNKSSNGKMNIAATVESDRSNFTAEVNVYFIHK